MKTIDDSLDNDEIVGGGCGGCRDDSYSDKKQRVTLNNEVSEWSDVLRGVPQGSILGPLLFNIYVNDLPDVANNSTINLYADNTTINLCY